MLSLIVYLYLCNSCLNYDTNQLWCMQGYYILAAVVKLRVISQLFLTLEAKFEFNHTSPLSTLRNFCQPICELFCVVYKPKRRTLRRGCIWLIHPPYTFLAPLRSSGRTFMNSSLKLHSILMQSLSSLSAVFQLSLSTLSQVSCSQLSHSIYYRQSKLH